jgi:ribosomal protein L37AE/L43A
MEKCPKCDADNVTTSRLTATVWVCTKCRTLLNYDQLISLLEGAGVKNDKIKIVEAILRDTQVSQGI